MKDSLTRGLEKDAKEEMELTFKSALHLRKRLYKVIEEKKTKVIDAGLNNTSYDCPNWPYKQADTQGYARAIKEVLALLE